MRIKLYVIIYLTVHWVNSNVVWDALKSIWNQSLRKTTTVWICMPWELSSRLLLTPCLDCEKLFEYRLPYSTKAISGLHGRDVQTQKPTFNWTMDNFSEKKLFFQFFSFKIPFEWPCAWFYSKMSSASVTIYRIFSDLTAIVLIDPYIIQIIYIIWYLYRIDYAIRRF